MAIKPANLTYEETADMARMPVISGFYGASSVERGITEQVRSFIEMTLTPFK